MTGVLLLALEVFVHLLVPGVLSDFLLVIEEDRCSLLVEGICSSSLVVGIEAAVLPWMSSMNATFSHTWFVPLSVLASAAVPAAMSIVSSTSATMAEPGLSASWSSISSSIVSSATSGVVVVVASF